MLMFQGERNPLHSKLLMDKMDLKAKAQYYQHQEIGGGVRGDRDTWEVASSEVTHQRVIKG